MLKLIVALHWASAVFNEGLVKFFFFFEKLPTRNETERLHASSSERERVRSPRTEVQLGRGFLIVDILGPEREMGLSRAALAAAGGRERARRFPFPETDGARIDACRGTRRRACQCVWLTRALEARRPGPRDDGDRTTEVSTVPCSARRGVAQRRALARVP